MEEKRKKVILMCITLVFAIVLMVMAFKPYLDKNLFRPGVETQAVVKSTVKDRSTGTNSQQHFVTYYNYEVDGVIYEGHQVVSHNIKEGTTLKIYYERDHVEKSALLEVHMVALLIGFLFAVVSLFFLLKQH